VGHTWRRLFLSQGEAGALAVLLVASQGWNASVLHAMRVPGYDPAEASDEVTICPVAVVKLRRPVSATAANAIRAQGAGTPLPDFVFAGGDYLGSSMTRTRWVCSSCGGGAGEGRDRRGCAMRGPGEQKDDWWDVRHRNRGEIVA
jgi:hypothetical protein